jgi:tetratricopeptide (TPR) repeat protein
MFLMFSFASFAQSEKKYIRQGNREYEDNKYPESETTYRRALDENNESRDAVFNIGDALYKQKKYEDAAKQFIENHNINEDKGKKSESLYNLGNSLLMANKLQESIDAYKGSLRLNPKNPEAKYNLAYAQDQLKQQQQQQQQQQKNDKNKQDQNKEDQSKNNDQQQKTQPQDQQQQDKQQGISREDAERVLNALENDEKNVQKKVKLAKALKERVRTVKNW